MHLSWEYLCFRAGSASPSRLRTDAGYGAGAVFGIAGRFGGDTLFIAGKTYPQSPTKRISGSRTNPAADLTRAALRRNSKRERRPYGSAAPYGRKPPGRKCRTSRSGSVYAPKPETHVLLG